MIKFIEDLMDDSPRFLQIILWKIWVRLISKERG